MDKKFKSILKADSKIFILGIGSVAFVAYVIEKFFPKQKCQVLRKEQKFEVFKDNNVSKTGQLIKIGDTWLPEYMFGNLKVLKDIKHFNLNNDDVLVVSFPKSGTTWLQEVVTQMLKLNNPLNLKADILESSNMENRFPYLEYPYPGIKTLETQASPRLIKSHLPYHFMPESVVTHKRGRVIYIARQAKDVCVSYYFFVKMISFLNYKGTFLEFFDNFLIGKVAYGPWFDHVYSFWEHKDDDNILFITYEQLHKDPKRIIKKISEFLNINLTNEQIEFISNETKFEKMKNNPTANYSWWDDLGIRNKSESHFMRKGVVGDHKNYMTEDMIDKIDQCFLDKKSIINEIFSESSE